MIQKENKSSYLKLFIVSNILLLSVYILKSVLNISSLYYLVLFLLAISLGSFMLLAGGIEFMGSLKSRSVRRILVFLISLYVIIFTTLSSLRYLSFTANALDLGTFLQPLSNTMRGKFMEYTSINYPFDEKCRFGNHLEIIYLPMALFIHIFKGPYFFLFLQTLMLAISALPLYRIAVRVLKENVIALFFSVCYLCYSGLHYLNLFDVHGDSFAILFIFLAFDALLRNRKKYWIYIILALFCKEYVALTLFGLGITIFLMNKKRRVGIVTSLIAILYFLSAHYIIMPFFNRGELPLFEISRHYGHVGGERGLLGILTYLIFHPVEFIKLFLMNKNIESLFYMFFPVSFLPLFSPVYLIGAIPIILKDSLYGMNIGNHRLALVIPYIFIASIFTVKKILILKNRNNGWLINKNIAIVYLISFSILAMFFYGPTPIGHRFWREKRKFIIDQKDRAVGRLIKSIPEKSVISVSSHIYPHLAKREKCYIYPRPWSSSSTNFKDVEYLCIDTMDIKLVFPEMKNFTKDAFPLIIQNGFSKIDEEHGVFLLKKINYK